MNIEDMYEPEPERNEPYRDVGHLLSGDLKEERLDWLFGECDKLLAAIQREGAPSDAELINLLSTPRFSRQLRELFSAQDLPKLYHYEVAPTVATHPDVERLNAWGLDVEAAPEPESDAAADMFATLEIPREERPTKHSPRPTHPRFGSFIVRAYSDLYDRVTEAGVGMSTLELYLPRTVFGFDDTEISEVMGYFATLDPIRPPEGRDEYGWGPFYEYREELGLAHANLLGNDEKEELAEVTEAQPPAWRYVGEEAEASAAETAP